MSAVDESLNYEKMVHTYGTYQLSRVIQQSGFQTVTINTAGGAESIFEIPPKVINFSKSILSFTLTPDTTAGNLFPFANVDGYACIRQVQLYTRSGLYLCDINDFDRYSNMTMRRNTLNSDVSTWDSLIQNLLIGTATGSFSGLIPGLTSTSTFVAGPNYRYTVANNNIQECRYLLAGLTNTISPGINFNIPLDNIPECYLSENKDTYFGGEILYLRIVWGIPAKVLFNNAAIDLSGAFTAYANNISIQDLMFLVAVETNPVIENLIKAKVASVEGLQMLIPMVYYNKLSLGAATTQNITTRYNRAHGIKLKKIYWTAYNATESSNTAFDHNNLAGAKVTQYYTMVNNIRTSQYDYVLANLDDYIVKMNSLKRSAIYSSNDYYYNWVWVEDFTDNNPLLKQFYELKDNYIEGLDLENEIKYDIYSTTVNAVYNHYVYAITEKMLTISSAGITLI